MKELLLIGFIAFLFWLWRNSMMSREISFTLAKQACANLQVQLLDDTVSLNSIKLCRNRRGTMALCRVYSFEFTQSGEARFQGKIALNGLEVKDVVLDTHQEI